ncbi:MAG: NADAR family protein [Bacteriovoracaceae bacterium]
MKKLLIAICLICSSLSFADYPSDWWKPFPKDQAESWEILPQEAKAGEVILSKRTELGIFSNLSPSPIEFENEKYASVESFWQMMKFPDLSDATDTRQNYASEYGFTRDQVKTMVMFDAKHAGDIGNKVMRDHKFSWISYQGKKFEYKDLKEGSDFHYKLIYQVILAKIEQNPEIKKLLLETGDLKLLPDHFQAANSPKAYFYNDILMDIRAKLLNQ